MASEYSPEFEPSHLTTLTTTAGTLSIELKATGQYAVDILKALGKMGGSEDGVVSTVMIVGPVTEQKL